MIESRDEDMADREAERVTAAADIDAVLTMFEQDSRNPDTWERTCLIYALDEAHRGCYRLAVASVAMAKVPHEQRSATSKLPSDVVLENWNLQKLRRTWRMVNGEPTKRHENLFGFSLVD